MDGRVIFLIAPPGAGKGTQARKLVSLGFLHVEMSKVLMKLNPSTAKTIGGARLVDSSTVIEALKDYLEPFSSGQDMVIDGFPRTEAQARFATAYFGQIHVAFVVLETDDEECERRVRERYEQDLMNHQENGAKAPRTSDLPETHRERLQIYRQEMVELEDFLKHHAASQLHRVDGHLSPDEIADVIRMEVLKSKVAKVS